MKKTVWPKPVDQEVRQARTARLGRLNPGASLSLDEKISIKGALSRYDVLPTTLVKLTLGEALAVWYRCTGAAISRFPLYRPCRDADKAHAIERFQSSWWIRYEQTCGLGAQ